MSNPHSLSPESFGLIYSEVRDTRPEIQASFPKYSEEVERIVLLRSIPHKRQNELRDIFLVYQITSNLIGISYLRNLARSRTLSGSQVACLTWVTNSADNPLKLKPFLESITLSFLRVVVDDKLMKKIVEEIVKNKGILRFNMKQKGTPLSFSIGIPKESDLPIFFQDLNKNVCNI